MRGIRRLISRPEQLTFYLCYAPQGRPATMTYFITITGRRWPVEETFKAEDVLGWDQSQIRSFEGICRHTPLAALAQLRHVAIRGAPPPASPADHVRRLPLGRRQAAPQRRLQLRRRLPPRQPLGRPALYHDAIAHGKDHPHAVRILALR